MVQGKIRLTEARQAMETYHRDYDWGPRARARVCVDRRGQGVVGPTGPSLCTPMYLPPRYRGTGVGQEPAGEWILHIVLSAQH